MNSFQKTLVLISIFVLSSCSSLGWLKFWGDDDEEEGPAELYKILENRVLDRQWSSSNSNDLVSGRLIPAVYDGNIYHISSSGNLLSIDLESGKKLWSKSTQDVVSSGLDVNFNTISYGTLDGHLVTLDQRNGQEIWRSPTSSESLSPPVHSGSHIILQTIDGRITGFNAKTGEQDWFHQTVVPPLTLRGTARPFLDEGFIFTGFANGKIAMIYPDSGAVRLELPVTLNEGKSELERIVDVDGRPIIVNGILVSASYQGNILALNLRDGKGIWQQELSTYKDLTANGNRIVAVDSEDIVKAFGTATGALIWEQEDLKKRELTAPASISNLIVVGDFEGYVHLLNAQNGNFEGREKISGDPITEIVSKGNYLLIVDSSGRVQKFTVR